MKVWTIPVIWFILLTVGFLLPGKTLPVDSWDLADNFDKILHFLAYMGLALCIGWANERRRKWNDKQLFLVLIVVAIYSSLLEGMQGLLYQDRYFEVFDILANVMGLISGYWISVKFLKTKQDGI